MDDVAIKVDHVSKTFKLPHERHTSIKSALINLARGGNRSYERQEVLKDVSFEIKKGEFFGIVGRNGSGKSTLLKMLAGIYAPTKGGIHVNGKLTPFIELGVGFNHELTGRENVFLNGALLGFNRKEMLEMYDDIVAFAELEKFMDQKLKNYSSGMQVRLAFSIAIRAQSEILVLDEVLAVGDSNFQAKCFEYFRTLKSSSRTVVFVSHDRGAVQDFCDRAVLIDMGNMVSIGETKKVLAEYDRINMNRLEKGASVGVTVAIDDEVHKKAEIVSCHTLRNGKRATSFMPDDEISIVVKTKFNAEIEHPVLGLVINRVGDTPIFATNTKTGEIATKVMHVDDTIEITYNLKNRLGNGRYTIAPAVASQDTRTMFDWRDAMTTFTVSGWEDGYMPVHLEHSMRIST
jgi:ABC-2 type transport system ATP-binding protein